MKGFQFKMKGFQQKMKGFQKKNKRILLGVVWVSSLGVGVWSLRFGVDLFIGHGDLAEDRPQREGHV